MSLHDAYFTSPLVATVRPKRVSALPYGADLGGCWGFPPPFKKPGWWSRLVAYLKRWF